MDIFGLFKSKKRVVSEKGKTLKIPTNKKKFTASDFITESKDWYRDQYKRMTKVTLVTLVILFVSVLFNVFLFIKEPPTRFFATTNDLRVVELTPMDEPLITDNGLTNWVSEVVGESFSYSFTDWRESFMEVRQHYVEKSYNAFLTAMQESGNLEMVRKNRLISKAGVDPSRVVITNRGLIGKKHTWRMEVPLNITYESSQGTTNRQELMGTVIVQRVSIVEHPRGVKIIQMRFK